MLIASIYLEQNISNEGIKKQLFMLNKNSKDNKCRLFIGGDFNSHHPLWGSHNDDNRCEKLFECLCSLDLHILNDGSITYWQYL